MDETTTLYLDAVKWKNQLIQENSVLRKRIAELEARQLQAPQPGSTLICNNRIWEEPLKEMGNG